MGHTQDVFFFLLFFCIFIEPKGTFFLKAVQSHLFQIISLTHIITYTLERYKIHLYNTITTQHTQCRDLKKCFHTSCVMHSAQLIFLPSFKSVKVNGSHYVCSPPTLARRHTDMHTQSIQSHYF